MDTEKKEDMGDAPDKNKKKNKDKKKKKGKRVTLVTPKDTEELVGGGNGVGEVERNWRGVLIALLVILVVLSMILLSTVLLSPALLDPGAGSRMSGKKIVLEDLLESKGQGAPLSRTFTNNATWISDTELIYRDPSGGVSILNVENSTVRSLVSNSIFRQLNAVDFRVSNDLRFILLLVDVQKVYTNARRAYYHVFDVDTMSRYPLHAGTGVPEDASNPPGSSSPSSSGQPLEAVLWSPSGSALAFVQNGDVYYCPSADTQHIGGHAAQEHPNRTDSQEARTRREHRNGNGLPVIRITDSGSAQVKNGVPDWIYQEEIFKTDSAMWFNPSGDMLAFVQFNDTLVGRVGYTRYTEKQPIYPPLEYLHYPKAGTTNPTVTLCLLNLTNPRLNRFRRIEQPKVISPDGQSVSCTDYPQSLKLKILPEQEAGDDGNRPGYLTLVRWTSNREIVTVWSNRRQNMTVYWACRAPQWNCTNVHVQVAAEGEVLSLWPHVLWSPDERLVTVAPVLDGSNGHFEQACLLRGASQKVTTTPSPRPQGASSTRRSRILPLTGGRMTVTRLVAWDVASSAVYFEAAPGGRPAQRHLYRVGDEPTPRRRPPVCITCPVEGDSKAQHHHVADHPHHPENGNRDPEHINHWKEVAGTQNRKNLTEHLRPVATDDCLYVRATFPKRSSNTTAPFKYYMLECLGPAVPTVHVMDARTHAKVVTLEPNSELHSRYASKSTPQIKIFQVEVEGGYHAQVKLQLPHGLREYEDMAFPMILRTSFKPGEQCVDYRWSVDYASYLTSQKNFIVAEIDGRGSYGSGTSHMNRARLKLGNLDAQDQIAVVGYLRDNLKFVDKEKIGIFGSGYGGYLTGMILSQDTDIFHCGLSISGIYSWPHYNSVWTERWLATANLTDNLRGYEESDLTRRVGNLKDRKYLVIHGTGDMVANYQHPMLLVKALIQEGVLFKHINYPDEGHDLSGVLGHLYRTLDAHWVDCFGEIDFTDWEIGGLDSFAFKT